MEEGYICQYMMMFLGNSKLEKNIYKVDLTGM